MNITYKCNILQLTLILHELHSIPQKALESEANGTNNWLADWTLNKLIKKQNARMGPVLKWDKTMGLVKSTDTRDTV